MKMVIFHSYVKLPEGMGSPTINQNWLYDTICLLSTFASVSFCQTFGKLANERHRHWMTLLQDIRAPRVRSASSLKSSKTFSTSPSDWWMVKHLPLVAMVGWSRVIQGDPGGSRGIQGDPGGSRGIQWHQLYPAGSARWDFEWPGFQLWFGWIWLDASNIYQPNPAFKANGFATFCKLQLAHLRFLCDLVDKWWAHLKNNCQSFAISTNDKYVKAMETQSQSPGLRTSRSTRWSRNYQAVRGK